MWGFSVFIGLEVNTNVTTNDTKEYWGKVTTRDTARRLSEGKGSEAVKQGFKIGDSKLQGLVFSKFFSDVKQNSEYGE